MAESRAVKSVLESLGPTRVRLTVEVPFEELRPSVDAAYRSIGHKVRVAGFRPGKVPARILDQRVGRGAVLEEAVQSALPRFYGEAVREREVSVLGHPDVAVTEFADGGQLVFTAEVDVRPEITLPDYAGLPVSVDDADVADEEVDEHLSALRDRFATLTGVSRPAAAGDFVVLDLRAAVDGEEVDEARTTGLSHEVGSGTLMPGLDDVLVGMAEGDSRTFSTPLVAGEHAGRAAEVTVTVHSVREKSLPELDDDFAQTASEFDTVAELREDTRSRLARVKRLEQGVQARDAVLAALLDRTDVPVPEHPLAEEVAWRQESFRSQLDAAGLTREEYLGAEGRTPEQFDAEMADGARRAVQAQFLLDTVAAREGLGVTDAEFAAQVVRRAQRSGVEPEAYARRLAESGSVGEVFDEVRRSKALALVLDQARVTDASGRPVDLQALSATVGPPGPSAAS